MWPLLARAGGYVALTAASAPIVTGYDYGSYYGDPRSLWTRLIISVALAAIVAIIGETALRISRKFRRH